MRYLVLSLFAACSSTTPPGDPTEVRAVLDDFHDAAAKADEARYFGHFANDGVFLGTDATERWNVPAFRAYAHPHFAKGKAWAFRSIRHAESIIGDLAWFDEDLATPNLGPARGSGVLVRKDGAWKILQYNLALTVPNERFDAVKDAIASTTIEAVADDQLGDLAWLAGSWVSEKDGTITEEHWSAPRGSLMLGTGHAIRDHLTVAFEFMRIEGRKEGTVLVAQPRGGDATEFTRVPDPKAAIFENRAHDWPKRITYTRVPEGLKIRVEGDPGQDVDEAIHRPAVIARALAP